MDAIYQKLTDSYNRIIARFGSLVDNTSKLYLLKEGVHGIDHWVRTCMYALFIGNALWFRDCLEKTPSLWFSVISGSEYALEDAIVYSSFFHDCARMTDGEDSEHSWRAAEIWSAYSQEASIGAELSVAVKDAIISHNRILLPCLGNGIVTVLLCNGDRLDRIRLGASQGPNPSIASFEPNEHIRNMIRMYGKLEAQ